MCFPGATLVLTEDGPKPLDEIKVHDKILAYDKESGKSKFAEVIAWLHRDTNGYLDFEQI